jgi:proteasome accessory factor C
MLMPKLKNVLSGDDQFNFLISLIGLVQREGEIHIEAAAERLGMSVAAIRKAMETLVKSGGVRADGHELLPFNFDWDLFHDEGVLAFLESGIITDAPRISMRQASAIAAGLSYLRALPEFASESEIEELIALLASSQPASTPPTIAYEVGTVGADVATLRKAILAQQQITCNYINQRGEASDRTLEPLRLDLQNSQWYLRAWCPVSELVKSFRLDRMRQVQISSEARSVAATEALAAIDEEEDRLYIPGEHDTDVVVEVDPEAYDLVAEYTHLDAPRGDSAGTIQVTIKVGYLPNLGHLISKYGGAARVISPAIARDIVRNYALESLGEFTSEQTPENED